MPTFPVVQTPDGPAHSFLNLAPKTPPPFRWEVEKADVQEFIPQPTLFATPFAAPAKAPVKTAAKLGPLFGD